MNKDIVVSSLSIDYAIYVDSDLCVLDNFFVGGVVAVENVITFNNDLLITKEKSKRFLTELFFCSHPSMRIQLSESSTAGGAIGV